MNNPSPLTCARLGDIIVQFPDSSASFRFGFEAGTYYGLMHIAVSQIGTAQQPLQLSDDIIEFHRDVAKMMGYLVIACESDAPGYQACVFQRIPPPPVKVKPTLSIIQGGKQDGV